MRLAALLSIPVLLVLISLGFILKNTFADDEPYTYYISYDANGGGYGQYFEKWNPDVEVYYSDSHNFTFAINGETPTRDGYKFDGWCDNVGVDDSCNGDLYLPGASYAPTTTAVTLKAMWSMIQLGSPITYQIAYRDSDGSMLDGINSDTYGPTSDPFHEFGITGFEPTKEGYEFLGWSTFQGGTYPSYESMPGIAPYHSITPHYYYPTITLYAVWQSNEKTTYTVSFDSNTPGGLANMPSSTSCTRESGQQSCQVTLPDGPQRDGYTFLGWYYALDIDAYFGDSVINVSSDLKLYAKWEEIDGPYYPYTYYISYDADGGVGTPAVGISYDNWPPNKKLLTTKNVPTKDGYEFQGWCADVNTNGECNGLLYADGATYTMTTTAVTLKAIYRANQVDAQVVTFPQSSVTKSIDDSSFTMTASTTGDGAITYESSDTNVATINASTGEVTIVGVGSTTITATAAATDNYAQGSATYTLTVQSSTPETKQNQTVSFDESTITKTYGDSKFTNTATTTGDGTITYSSNNTAVASVNPTTGEVTILSAGSAIITATAAETDSYYQGSASYTLTVNKANHTISFMQGPSITKTYGDSNFTNTAYSSAGIYDSFTITYSSSNTAVATVNPTTGEVTITGVGTTIITAASSATAKYNEASASYTLTVQSPTPPTKQNQTVSFDESTITKTYGDGKFTNTATTTGDGTITYSSNNTAVATVDANTGEVTIKAAGTATIIATAAETDSYNQGLSSYTLTVSKAPQPVHFENTSITKTYGDSNFTNSATTTGGGTITYSSSDANVASVDANTGEVTIKAAGTVTITATASATANYNQGSTNYSLTINSAAPLIHFTNTAITKNSNDAPFTNVATSSSDGAITYSSSNTAVATVDVNTGEVTIKAAGNTTITAHVAATGSYSEGSAAYTLTVLEAGGDKKYVVTEGDNQTVVLDGNEYITFRIDAAFSLFEPGGSVYIDGNQLSADYYIAESGSTVVKIRNSYLSTLSLGEHTLTVNFNDGGTATATFAIAKSPAGDDEGEDGDSDNNGNNGNNSGTSDGSSSDDLKVPNTGDTTNNGGGLTTGIITISILIALSFLGYKYLASRSHKVSFKKY